MIAFMALLLSAHAWAASPPAPGPAVPSVDENPLPGAQADFGQVPPASTLEDSKALWKRRARLALETEASFPVIPYGPTTGGAFPTRALAKLALEKDIPEVNLAILDPKAVPYAKPGTDFHALGHFCERTGDYDFVLRNLVVMMYVFGDRPDLLWPESRQKILHSWLTQKGNAIALYRHFGICAIWRETENHILMTESSRYLTNQLLLKELRAQGKYEWLYDNEANGMSRWMLGHLQEFLKRDFYELNSRPYQAYAVLAIENLYDFSENPKVKLAAGMVLDYLAGKFAVSSNELRRSVPFRRQPPYVNNPDVIRMDAETIRFSLQAGNTARFAELNPPNQVDGAHLVPGALSTYRTPDLLVDLIVAHQQPGRSYWSRFHHTAWENYAATPSFLVSGGGIYVPFLDPISNTESGWSVPTVLMPSKGGVNRDSFIRIDGDRRLNHRSNLCVAPGFACGLNPVVPDSMPAGCVEREGKWTFVDFTSPQCPLQYGFFVAVHSDSCDSHECREGGDSFGFFEAAEPAADLDFAAFKAKVLGNNDQREYRSRHANVYITSQGIPIEFVPHPAGMHDWGIRSYDGRRFGHDARRWPLAQGEYMRSKGDGLVVLDNPYLRKRLVLDDRDAENPVRTEESY